MPQLMGDEARVELGILSAESEVVGVNVQDASHQRAEGIDTPEPSFLVRLVVEDPFIGLGGLADEGIGAPRSVPENPPDGIKALPDIGSFPDRDDPLRPVCELLTARAEREPVFRIGRERKVDKPPMHIELITVSRAGSASPSALDVALELPEDPGPGPEMEIHMGHVSLRPESIWILWSLSPLSIVEILISLAPVAAERQIDVPGVVER